MPARIVDFRLGNNLSAAKISRHRSYVWSQYCPTDGRAATVGCTTPRAKSWICANDYIDMYVKQITYRLVLLQPSRRNSSINSCLSYRIWGQTPLEFRPKKSSLYSRRGVSAVGFPPSEIHLATWQVQYHLNQYGGSMEECASYLRYSDVLRYKVIHLGQLLDNHWPNRKWSWVRVSPGLWLTEVSGYNFYIPHLPGKSVDDIISQKNICQYDCTARTGGMKETFHLWQIDIFISIYQYIYIYQYLDFLWRPLTSTFRRDQDASHTVTILSNLVIQIGNVGRVPWEEIFEIHSSRRRFHGDYVEPCILMPRFPIPQNWCFVYGFSRFQGDIFRLEYSGFQI